MATSTSSKRAHAAIRRFALSYPEAWEDHPWGETAIKVRAKVFVFLGAGEGPLSLSVKLPASHGAVLTQAFARPTAYGLGRAGWVTMTFEATEAPPLDVLHDWIDESYRAVAPKALSRTVPLR